MRGCLIAAGLLVSALSAAGVPGGLFREVVAAPAADLPGQTNPLPPVPVLPADGETVFGASPTLVVESSVPSGWFHFRVMEGASVAAEGYSPGPSWNVGAAGQLQAGHRYEWSCRVRDEWGWSEWFSPTWGFAVSAALRPPEPKLPADGSVVRARRPVFVVKPVMVPASYHFQVWDGRTIVSEGLTDRPVWIGGGSGGLEPGRLYSWTCRIELEGDSSAWFSPQWRFETAEPSATDGEAGSECPAEVRVEAEPNPLRWGTMLALGPASSFVDISIHSSDGRLVRRGRVATHGASATFRWDGRDESGRMTGPGTYVCRVSQDGQPASSLKLVKVGY